MKYRNDKDGLLNSFKSLFLMESGKEVAGYLVKNVIVPKVRDLIYDTTIEGINQVVYGPNGIKRNPGVTYSQSAQTNTGSTYKNRTTTTTSITATPKLSDIAIHKFTCRADAENTLEFLRDYGMRYGCVSVLSFCESAKIKTGGNYVWNDYGWDKSEIESANIKFVPGGYMIDLPPCHPLK